MLGLLVGGLHLEERRKNVIFMLSEVFNLSIGDAVSTSSLLDSTMEVLQTLEQEKPQWQGCLRRFTRRLVFCLKDIWSKLIAAG